jgi:hypothetical protein
MNIIFRKYNEPKPEKVIFTPYIKLKPKENTLKATKVKCERRQFMEDK